MYILGQITIIPKPELRSFWEDSPTKPPFGVTSAEVVTICPDRYYIYIRIYHCSTIPSTFHQAFLHYPSDLFHLGALSNGTNLLQGSPFRLHQRRLGHLAVFENSPGNESIYPFIKIRFLLNVSILHDSCHNNHAYCLIY